MWPWIQSLMTLVLFNSNAAFFLKSSMLLRVEAPAAWIVDSTLLQTCFEAPLWQCYSSIYLTWELTCTASKTIVLGMHAGRELADCYYSVSSWYTFWKAKAMIPQVHFRKGLCSHKGWTYWMRVNVKQTPEKYHCTALIYFDFLCL